MDVQALLTFGLMAQLGAALPPDSVDALRDRARSAEARFERLARRLAPVSWSAGYGQDCDEIVGRFCLTYDSGESRPPALDSEAATVVDARREAVEALRRYFSAAPHELSAAGPLVRLLILDGRAREAASAAGAFAALSGDTLWGELLQGLARHRAGAPTTAERHFIAALGRLDDAERRRWLDPSWLLNPDERRVLRRMTPDERSQYERKLWLLMDPFWLTPGNESWNEHIGRHVEAHLLAEVPRVQGMLSWGRDLEELTIRYGTPSMRARQLDAPGRAPADGMIEYWDTAARAFAPARLSEGVDAPPDPGVKPPLYAETARTSYAFQNVASVVELTHQITRFVRGDSVLLRVDAAMPWSRESGGPPRAGAFVYDTAFTRRFTDTDIARIDRDSARATLLVATPPGRIVYSAEMLGDSAAAAGRARYAIDALIPDTGPIVSDLLISPPFAPGDAPDRLDHPNLRPVQSLIFGPGDTVGIYAEVYRLPPGRAVDVEVALESAGRPSLLGRLARWIGRGLGIIKPADDPRVGWRGEPDDSRHVVALNVPLGGDRDGLHDLVIVVTDPVTGERTEGRRRILIRP